MSSHLFILSSVIWELCFDISDVPIESRTTPSDSVALATFAIFWSISAENGSNVNWGSSSLLDP